MCGEKQIAHITNKSGLSVVAELGLDCCYAPGVRIFKKKKGFNMLEKCTCGKFNINIQYRSGVIVLTCMHCGKTILDGNQRNAIRDWNKDQRKVLI